MNIYLLIFYILPIFFSLIKSLINPNKLNWEIFFCTFFWPVLAVCAWFSFVGYMTYDFFKTKTII